MNLNLNQVTDAKPSK
jgi:hypothetical protein